jgi:hypothetical protein
MTTAARSDRLLAVARDEWPALRWHIHVDPAFTLLRGRDRRGHRVVSVCQWGGDGPWVAVLADEGETHAGRTLRAAVRAARYALNP